MYNFKEIARGFINSTKSELDIANPEIERLAELRYEYCLQCPHISDTKLRCSKDKGGYCNCFLKLKTRSNEVCPKWSNIK